jgi:LPXTG-site transpeptidase (sortase) family protein
MKKKSDQTVSKPDLIHIYRQALVSNTSIETLDKKLAELWTRSQISKDQETSAGKTYQKKIKSRIPPLVRYGALLLPVGFISLGMFLVGNAIIPILGFYSESVTTAQVEQLTLPIPEDEVLPEPKVVIASSYVMQEGGAGGFSDGPTIIDTQLDYTNLANWFSDGQLPELAGGGQAGAVSSTEYVIDIPKLNIKNASVKIGGTDLNSGLIQYAGTADPGSAGAPVIFGHSVLPQFYNPSEKNPRRYVSIFSKIMSLTDGDDIYVTQDGVKYHYVMREKVEVQPEDVHILTQEYDKSSLKLVTCTPPGTYLKRGVVTAELVK